MSPPAIALSYIFTRPCFRNRQYSGFFKQGLIQRLLTHIVQGLIAKQHALARVQRPNQYGVPPDFRVQHRILAELQAALAFLHRQSHGQRQAQNLIPGGEFLPRENRVGIAGVNIRGFDDVRPFHPAAFHQLRQVLSHGLMDKAIPVFLQIAFHMQIGPLQLQQHIVCGPFQHVAPSCGNTV